MEDCYYQVGRYFLTRDSEVFRDMFMCPSGSSDAEGKTKETAIPLPGVTKFEMTSLLRFFYYGYDYEMFSRSLTFRHSVLLQDVR